MNTFEVGNRVRFARNCGPFAGARATVVRTSASEDCVYVQYDRVPDDLEGAYRKSSLIPISPAELLSECGGTP